MGLSPHMELTQRCRLYRGNGQRMLGTRKQLGGTRLVRNPLKRGSGGKGPLSLKELQPLFPGVGVGAGSAQMFWGMEDRVHWLDSGRTTNFSLQRVF